MARGRPKVKVTPSYVRRSAFDEQHIGVKKDPSKSYRWVSKNRIEERVNSDGYEFVKPPKNTSTQSKIDGATTTEDRIQVKGMYYMSRPKRISEERRREKEARTRYQSQGAKAQMSQNTEALSRKYGINLHKLISNEEGDN